MHARTHTHTHKRARAHTHTHTNVTSHTLSSLSTEEQTVRNLSDGTPQASNKPSSSCRWFTLIRKSPIFKVVSISLTTRTHSTSGTMGSYWPAMSKSCKHCKFNKPHNKLDQQQWDRNFIMAFFSNYGWVLPFLGGEGRFHTMQLSPPSVPSKKEGRGCSTRTKWSQPPAITLLHPGTNAHVNKDYYWHLSNCMSLKVGLEKKRS